MASLPGQDIPVGNRAQAEKNQRAVINDLSFVLEQLHIKKQDLNVRLNAQQERVKRFIADFKKNKSLEEYELCPRVIMDISIVKHEMEGVLDALLRKELRGFLEKARGDYQLVAVLRTQLEIISGIEKVADVYMEGKGFKDTRIILDALFTKLESWLSVEEVLLKPWMKM